MAEDVVARGRLARGVLGSNLGQLLDWAAGNHGIDLGEKMFFCAQLVAESWKRLGVLPIHPPSNKYSERDYCEAYGTVQLLRGATLSPEISIELTEDADGGREARRAPQAAPGRQAGRDDRALRTTRLTSANTESPR